MVRVVSLKHLAFWEKLADRQSFEVVHKGTESLEKKDSAFFSYELGFCELNKLLEENYKCFVIYPATEMILEEHLSKDVELNEAIEFTLDFSERLLTLFKKYRNKVILLNASHLDYATSQGLDTVSELGWHVESCKPSICASALTSLALHIIHSNSKLKRIFNTLDGCSSIIENEWITSVEEQSLSILKESKKIDTDQELTINKLEKMNDKVEADKAKLINKLEEKTKEGKLHLLQIFELQEGLERQIKRHKIEQASSTAKLNKVLKNLDEEKVALKVENELLLKQIFNLQAELENYYSSFVRMRKQNEGLNEKIKKKSKSVHELLIELRRTKNEVSTIRRSLAWKIGKPIRALASRASKLGISSRVVTADLNTLKSSELFDADWYLKTYPDVANSGMTPAEHYLLFGGVEGRHPSQSFDAKWYLSQYSDVAQSGVNPLLHYLKFGKDEGRYKTLLLMKHNVDK